MLRIICVHLFLLFSTQLFAQGNVAELFEEHFHTKYIPGRCGINALNFIKSAEENFGAANELTIVSMKNTGLSVFGMINAEKTRGLRYQKPAVVEANWYHHAFVVDNNGMVYDFDFGIEPRITHINEYLEEMFLNEPECENKGWSGRFCAGRKYKLSDYEMIAISGADSLKKDEGGMKKMYMKDVVENWQNLLP